MASNGKNMCFRWQTVGNAWLISYDICNPRRLTRVHRLLRSCAIPLQYSVFLALLDRPAGVSTQFRNVPFSAIQK